MFIDDTEFSLRLGNWSRRLQDMIKVCEELQAVPLVKKIIASSVPKHLNTNLCSFIRDHYVQQYQRIGLNRGSTSVDGVG